MHGSDDLLRSTTYGPSMSFVIRWLVELMASVGVTKPDCEPPRHDGATSVNLWDSRPVEFFRWGTRQDDSSGGDSRSCRLAGYFVREWRMRLG